MRHRPEGIARLNQFLFVELRLRGGLKPSLNSRDFRFDLRQLLTRLARFGHRLGRLYPVDLLTDTALGITLRANDVLLMLDQAIKGAKCGVLRVFKLREEGIRLAIPNPPSGLRTRCV